MLAALAYARLGELSYRSERPVRDLYGHCVPSPADQRAAGVREAGPGDAHAGRADDLRGPVTPLRPLVRDEFSAGPTLRFVRDGSGAVTGFMLDAGRVRNLRFARVAG
jgi:hypothetical protein